MELHDDISINESLRELPVLPFEVWQLIVAYLDEIEKIKFGIAVLGFENIIGCSVSILSAIKLETGEESIAKQRKNLFMQWVRALNCFSVDFEKFWGSDSTCVFCKNEVWSHLRISDRLVRVDPTLYKNSQTESIQVNRIIENLFSVSNEYEDFGIRYKFTYLQRGSFSDWKGSITLSKSCHYCKIRFSREYENNCAECNGGGAGVFCGCGLFYCFNEASDVVYGLCIDCNAMCCYRCADVCDNKCYQICLRCVNECEICHQGALCRAHYELSNKHRNCAKVLKNTPLYGRKTVERKV